MCTEAPFPVPCVSTNPPLLVVTSLPLCLHCTDSRLVLTGSEVCTSQMSTDDWPTVAFLGMTNTEFCKEPINIINIFSNKQGRVCLDEYGNC